MKIAITGDTGFIGTALKAYLSNYGVTPVSLSRKSIDFLSGNTLGDRLLGVDTVIHLAGVAHNPEATYEDYFQGNVTFTENLCQHIAEANRKGLCSVKKIVMISSIKVMGEFTEPGSSFKHSDPCYPQDDYGKTKLLAENRLREICAKNAINWTIIRPPLVFSPKARGNLGAIQTFSRKGIPIPLGAIDNKRDLVSIHNLCSLIYCASINPESNQQVLLVSDGQALSTSDILAKATERSEKKIRLINLPNWASEFCKKYQHKHGLLRRLFGNLEVDIQHTRETLNWTPKQEP